MSDRASPAGHATPRINMEYEVEIRGVTHKVQLPFVTGVMADLSGTPAAAPEPVADRAFFEIDQGNFDARMAAIRPRLVFAVPNALAGEGHLQVELTFGCMADFSPAAIARRVHPLRALLEARPPLGEATQGQPGAVDVGDGDTTVAASSAELDRRLALQLNLILHSDDLQRLEGAWRGLHYLVSHTETDELLRIKVLNISKSELARTLKRYKGESWDESPIFRMIYRDGYGSSGGAPFGCLVGDYAFDHSPPDIETLVQIGKICEAAYTPFLAAASPGVMQMDSWQELPTPRNLSKIFGPPEYAPWRALRAWDGARYLGLALPRFLARPPYRSDSDPRNEFAFEEDIRDLDHAKFVWANPAYLMAVNIHWSFKTHGWCTRVRGLHGGGAVEGLPVVTQADGHGGITTLCPTEVAIDDRREAELSDNGFIALVHRRDSDMAAFVSTPSLGIPREHDDAEARANARLSVQLPYLFATCRIAHYIKAIVRDRFAASLDRQSVHRWLQDWIANYVDPAPGTADALTRWPKPLAAATVIVEEAEGNPDSLTAKVYIRLND